MTAEHYDIDDKAFQDSAADELHNSQINDATQVSLQDKFAEIALFQNLRSHMSLKPSLLWPHLGACCLQTCQWLPEAHQYPQQLAWCRSTLQKQMLSTPQRQSHS